jgi:ribonuclease D
MKPVELYVDEPATLDAFLDELADTRIIGVDTEFVREKTYYPQLCLTQIATPTTIACIDCLAGLDLGALFERVLNREIGWILHSSRQDLEVIHQHAARLPNRLIDTQIAAGLAGFAPQIGLQELVSETLGVTLQKDYTRTDWSRRPLPAAAIEYARDDVRSLHALWHVLAEKLDALGRSAWVEQDCATLTAQSPLPSAEQIWLRMRSVRGLGTEAAAAALALVDWREARAQARNRPRRWILSDEHLLAIAKRYPLSIDALRRVPDLPNRIVERQGREILAALRSAEEAPILERATAVIREEPPKKRQIKLLQDAAKSIADRLGVYAEVVATKQELTELLMDRVPTRFASTWRSDLVAELTSLI